MIIQCENCGGSLQVLHYEQELGQPKTRQWTMACPACGEVHQYDSAWVRVRSATDTAPRLAAKESPCERHTLAMAG